jgi:hypothetical protein
MTISLKLEKEKFKYQTQKTQVDKEAQQTQVGTTVHNI